MKILFDHQIFDRQRYGGISRFYSELFTSIRDDEDIACAIPLAFTSNHYLRDHVKPFLGPISFRGKGWIVQNLNRRKSIQALKEQQYDLFHPTYYDPYFEEYLGEKPFILTIYDMIYERYPEMFDSSEEMIRWKKQLTLTAAGIIAISESTKKDIVKYYGINADEVAVVPLASSMPRVSFTVMRHVEIPDKYILFVGNRAIYKNFNYFVKSIAPLLKRNSDLYILCAGGGGFNDDEMALFDHLQINDQILQYESDDSRMCDLYRNALMFVFPSLYEGFGIPVLESFACECPCVLSNTSSLPEIAGEAALYFDPVNGASIIEAVEKVLKDAGLRKQLIAKGRERSKKFTWKNTILCLKTAYASVMAGK